MSVRSKFSSNNSTPARLKSTEGSRSVASVKNFLTAALTPSRGKKWIKRKASKKSNTSMEEIHHDVRNISATETSGDLPDPNYSSIEDLNSRHLSPGELVFEEYSSATPTFIDKTSHSPPVHHATEPIYARVNKQKNTKCKVYENHDDIDASGTGKKTMTVQNTIPSINEEHCNRNFEDDHKEEIRLLTERLKDVTNENRKLHKNMEDLLNEKKWKEDALHAELKLKISQFENETHKEVKSLSDQVSSLQKERKVLLEEIDILHEEKRDLKAQNDELSAKVKSMVSPEFLAKIMDEHQRSLKQLEKNLQAEIQNLRQENKLALGAKISLSAEVKVWKEKLQALVLENETLKSNEQELTDQISRLHLQLTESKQMQDEAQNLLAALLKLTESISIERDVLLDKVSYHDNQESLIKNTIMDYSLNMGRLQEHISNFTKEKFNELQKLKIGSSAHDANLKYFYNGQLEVLRSKVLNQSSTISDLESEKGKLELQLESLWHNASLGKPKSHEFK